MTELLLILFAAGLIYYVATRVSSQSLIFKLKKEPKPEVEKEPEKAPAKPAESQEEGVLLKQGQDLFNKGNLEDAEKMFLSAIKIDPAAGQAYHFLGMIYLRQKIYKGAVAALEKAVKLDPLNDTAYNNLGLSYYNLGDQEKAIAAFEKSISLNDKIAHRFLNLALAHQKQDNLEKAAIALENAAKIHPNTESLTLLVKNYQLMKDKKLTKKSLEKLVEVDPENSWAKRQLAALGD